MLIVVLAQISDSSVAAISYASIYFSPYVTECKICSPKRSDWMLPGYLYLAQVTFCKGFYKMDY